MQKKRLSVLIALVLVCASVGSVFAQDVSCETELGTDSGGEHFFSQYVFFDTKNTNVLSRYFWVRGVLNRGELAAGPTLRFKKGQTLKLQIGGTTDREVMLALTYIAHFGTREVMYIADGKIATRDGPSTLYQKMFVPISSDSTWQLRVEHLQVGEKQNFLHIGVEVQRPLRGKKLLYIAPFVDPVIHGVGVQAGLRFF